MEVQALGAKVVVLEGKRKDLNVSPASVGGTWRVMRTRQSKAAPRRLCIVGVLFTLTLTGSTLL